MDKSLFNAEGLKARAPQFFTALRHTRGLDSARERLSSLIAQFELDAFGNYDRAEEMALIRVRDCADALRSILRRRSDKLAGFSVCAAIRDLALSKPRPDLSPAFYADLLRLFTGVQGADPSKSPEESFLRLTELKGREAALQRSAELDQLWAEAVEKKISRYRSGMSDRAIERRRRRKERILQKLGGTEADWGDWRWQVKRIARKPADLEGLVRLSAQEEAGIKAAREKKLPFGVTPYYLSLMDDEDEGRDRTIRAQVFPPLSYVENIAKAKAQGECSLDFMLEGDTSPIDLVTRRYPAIAIFKPFNACPQICVYCQRNWEIDEPMGRDSLATFDKIEAALAWIESRPAIHELLITGGDPLALGDEKLKALLERVAGIESIEAIRIGSRTPVTMPMRITEELADFLGGLRIPGRRQVSLATHVEHPYEITPELAAAVDRIKKRGISVYNQLVFTFFVSRRFEAAALRRWLRKVGIDPYYTFATKGKEETRLYWTPLARLLQEQKEEARLLPGLSRTDEAVFNVPSMGKTYLRAKQHRDLISILPDGARVYEFHPWEKNISKTMKTYIGRDLPILEYLERLEELGEDIADYGTIWYYF